MNMIQLPQKPWNSTEVLVSLYEQADLITTQFASQYTAFHYNGVALVNKFSFF